MHHDTDQPKATLNVEEARRWLGISRSLAYQMVREGTIPSIRLGRRILISKRALEDMLERPSLNDQLADRGTKEADYDVPG